MIAAIMGKKKNKLHFDPPPAIDWNLEGGSAKLNKLKSQLPADMNPDQMNPEQISQVQNMLKKLPHQQMQRLQSLMQKAMSGKDVTRDFEDFEKTLSPEMKEAFSQMSGQFGGAGATDASQGSTQEEDMTVDEAKKVIEQAVKEGRLTQEQAQELLNKK